MYITLTKSFIEYVENDCENVFTPQMWCLTEDECEYSWELTDEGAKLAERYLEDSSCGYDLCYGRAKGLASEYTDYSIFMELTTSSEYATNPLDEDEFNVYELI